MKDYNYRNEAVRRVLKQMYGMLGLFALNVVIFLYFFSRRSNGMSAWTFVLVMDSLDNIAYIEKLVKEAALPLDKSLKALFNIVFYRFPRICVVGMFCYVRVFNVAPIDGFRLFFFFYFALTSLVHLINITVFYFILYRRIQLIPHV